MRAGSLRAEQSEALRREWRAGSYGLLEGAAGAGAGQGPGGAARAGGGWGCNKGWMTSCEGRGLVGGGAGAELCACPGRLIRSSDPRPLPAQPLRTTTAAKPLHAAAAAPSTLNFVRSHLPSLCWPVWWLLGWGGALCLSWTYLPPTTVGT
jgi:hypothetical protein